MDDPSWLEKARGYLDLGMLTEAEAELEKLTPNQTAQPEAIELRIVLALEQGDFDSALSKSKDLIALDPDDHAGFIHGAYALHELDKTQEAIDFLQAGPSSLSDDQCYFYNLACYEVHLGREEAAITWLTEAIKLEPRNRDRAQRDPDLKSIVDQLPEEES